MRTRAAIVRSCPGSYEIAELEVDEPRQNEILVKLAAAGLCHSDDHLVAGDAPAGIYPICVGHEGAGVVQQVGPHTPGFAPGDHVVFSFIPSCGRCRWCASGRQNLCDLGAHITTGCRPEDPSSYRLHLPDGTPVGQGAGISTFSEYTTVNVHSAIRIDSELPLDRICLLGCGVGTGWGSAVNAAEAKPGETVIVMGIGGIGVNAVQGAAQVGATHVLAVDPVGFKREMALTLGATQAFASMEEAEEAAKTLTDGQGADSAIVTVGVTTGEHVAQAVSAIRKGGTVVVTGIGNIDAVGIPVKLAEITLYQKRIQGALFGQCSPNFDIPRQIAMYQAGQLKLDELVTSTYKLDEIAQGYADMHAGKNIRGIIVFD